MRFIGITGGIGAGKTVILKYLSEHYHCRVMLADEIAHDIMEPGTACNKSLQKLFEDDGVFDAAGRIDRSRMAKVLFSDERKRKALNDIVHPGVKEYVLQQAEEARQKNELDFLVLEAALLIEEHYDAICDELWYIYTSEEKRRMRLKEGRGYSDEKIDSILRSQLSESVFRSYCTEEIDNNGTPEETYQQLDEILSRKIK